MESGTKNGYWVGLQAVFFLLYLHSQVLAQEESVANYSYNEEEQLLSLSEENFVMAASRYKQSLREAPAVVTVITARDIEQYGWRTLGDVLRNVRGFFVTNDRNYEYAGVRGFGPRGDYNNKILLLINGCRTNDAFWSLSYIDNGAVVDLDSVKRIEIIRGPGSALYGASAMFAVINIITKSGDDVDGLETSYEARSFGTNKGILSYGRRSDNNMDIYFSVSALKMDGQIVYYKEYDDPATNHGYAEYRDKEEAYRFYTSLSLGDFTLQGGGRVKEKHFPTAAWETIFNDPDTRTVDEFWFADAKYEHNFNKTDRLMLRAFYNYYYYDGIYYYDSSTWGPPYGERARYDEITDTGYYGTELQFNLQPFEGNLLIVGGEYYNKYKLEEIGRDDVLDESDYEDNRDQRNWSLYLQDVQQFWGKLNLILGIRYDDYSSTFGKEWNPRLGLVYNPWEETTIKFLYGQAFRSPNNYELYFQNSLYMKSNPDLKPEKNTTYELAWEQAFPGHFSSTLSVFYYRMSDLITLVNDPADGLDQYVNKNNIISRGVELGIKGGMENSLQGHVDFTYQHTREKETGNKLLNSPDYTANLGLSFPLVENRVYLAAEEDYLSRRLTKDGSYADPAYITNLTLSTKNLWRRLRASFTVYNLFDQKYGDPAVAEQLENEIPQDGRSFRLKLTYTF